MENIRIPIFYREIRISEKKNCLICEREEQDGHNIKEVFIERKMERKMNKRKKKNAR